MAIKPITSLIAALVVVALTAGISHAQACNAGSEYTYTFTNYCAYPIWLAQFNALEAEGHPPIGNNWAIANACRSAADCPSGSQCESGQCTCTTNSDCPGQATCSNGLCSTTDVFCMPQAWVSGRFWPRTGCTLSGSTLNCATGQCGNPNNGALDCTAAQKTGNNPATLFEVTSSAGGVANYDVSLVDGGNVSLRAEPVVGSSSPACSAGGCISDLNLTCPTSLQVTTPATTTPSAIRCGDGTYCPEGTCVSNDGAPTCVIGCIAPCDRCSSDSSAAGLMCNDTISGSPSYATCSNQTESVTYMDLYCAKGADGNAMASGNQGTATCFSMLDCPPGEICYGLGSNPSAPALGVCINLKAPSNYANCFQTCGASTVGKPCGGYLEFFSDALGYTCQAVTWSHEGAEKTEYACLPPTDQGLGKCETQDVTGSQGGCPSGTNPPLYTSTASPANQDFVTAAIQAGGGTEPYYKIFKRACPHAYSFSYDDQSGGFACNGMTGFNIVFCPENALRSESRGFGLGNPFGFGNGLGLGNGIGLGGFEGLSPDVIERDLGLRDFDIRDF